MKTILLLILALSSAAALAQDTFSITSNVVVRDQDFKPQIRPMKLDRLLNPERFEGLHFKIVVGKGSEPVSIHEDPQLVLHAATAYYHLNKARDFYVNRMRSDYVRDMQQLVIRIEMKNQFNELGHFANDANDPQYNNALTVPAGEGLAGHNIKPWKIEVWFRPMKKLNIDDLHIRLEGMGEWDSLLAKVRDQTRMTTLQRFVSDVARSETVNNAPPVTWDDVLRTGGSTLMLELLFANAGKINDLFQRKWYWMDAALVPEIIYHEYSHVALSDYLELSNSTPVIEGMADYFAGVIADSPKLATGIKDFNVYSGKKAKRKRQYQAEFETSGYANSDFVFGMLWDLRDILGVEKAKDFVYSLREKLHTYDTIRRQLIEGILQTCNETCDDPSLDKLKILKRYNWRGI